MNKSIKIPVILGFILCTASAAGQALSLAEAVETGLENNFDIIIRRNDAQIAANDNTAGNAGFLPYVGLTATQNNNFSDTYQETNITADSIRIRDIDNARTATINAGVQLNWTLFDGFRMFVNKNSLGVLERMGETEAKLTVENTVSAIILGYYGIAQQEKLLRVLEDAAALSRERKAIMQARMDLGAGSELQLLQSTVDLNADSIALLREMSALEQLRADFNRLLARNPETSFTLTDSIALGDPLAYEGLLENARAQNTELQLARYSLDIDRLNVKALQSQRYPSLNLNAAYQYSRLTSETGFASYNRSFGPSFGFSLTYPIFDGFNVNRTIKNARIEMNSGEMMLQGTDLAIRTEIYKLFTAYRTNMKIVEIEQVNHRVAERNVEVAFEKYRLGTLSDIELRETQEKYIESQYQLLVSQFLAKRAEIELLRSSGQLEMAIK
jgi:outer membrane protein TolC